MYLDKIFKIDRFKIKIMSLWEEKKNVKWCFTIVKWYFTLEKYLKWLKQTNILTIFQNEND